MEQKPQQNIMGYEKIPRLVLKLSVPLMFSMIIQALYNVVDSIFVSRVSEAALTAVSLAFPLQNLLIAFGTGTGVGVNSLLARRLGEGNREGAEKVAHNGIFLALATYAVFLLFAIFGAKPFLSFYTDDPELLGLSVTYATIVLGFSFGMFLDMTAERILQATGDGLHPMLIQLTGAVANIILDPILIFGCHMGVAGAAAATVLGQIIAMFIALRFVSRNKFVTVRITPKRLRPDGRIIKEIYAIGFPSIIMVGISTVLVSGMNSILIAFSTTAVSVLGVYYKLQSFVFMPVMGLNNGMVPIIAFNYGARKKDRMLATLKFGCLIAVCIMAVGTLVFQIFPGLLLTLFAASDYMLEIGIPALRIISLNFIPAALAVSMGSVFQGTGSSIYSMIVSLARQLVVLLPVAMLIASFGVLEYVWFAFVIAEGFGLIGSIAFFIIVYRKKIKPLDQSQPESIN